MEPKNKYIPIAEFAKLVNLSPAAIYKRIKAGDKSILTYVTEIDGKKRINKKALELFGVTGNESVTSTIDNKLPLINEEILNMLKNELESRNQQLAKKDEQIDAYIKQIAEQNQQLENKDKQIAELNEHLKNQFISVRESHFIAAGGQITPVEDAPQPPPEKIGFRGWIKKHFG